MNKQILVLNVGSSSIKYRLYQLKNAEISVEGICERIMIDGIFQIKQNNQKKEINVAFPNHKIAVEFLLQYLQTHKIIEKLENIVGIGHRVAHGGELFSKSALVDEKVIEEIRSNIPLVPLHNSVQADIIEIVQQLLPKAVNVAVFDTSFHTTMLPVNQIIPIEQNLAKELRIKRYAFHGTSYVYITKKMEQILQKPKVNLVVLHLGNGSSATAIEHSCSINSSLSLSAISGLPMGTRCGDIDPAIPTFIMKMKNWDVKQIDELLNKKSGLWGLTGCSDMRDIEARAEANDPQAIMALDFFTKRCADFLVQLANDITTGLDAIVFTAGIGENSFKVRELITQKTRLLNLKLNPVANRGVIKDFALISDSSAQVPVYVVRTNEELMIFEDVKRFLTY